MKTIRLLAIVLIVSFISSCKKYYDDFFIELRSPEARIQGTWDLQYLYIGGIDSTVAAKNQPCYVPLKFWECNDQNPCTCPETINAPDGTSSNCSVNGCYNFKNNDADLSLDLPGNPNYQSVGPYRANIIGGVLWHIKKLSDDQLWLETTYNGLFCWMHLTK